MKFRHIALVILSIAVAGCSPSVCEDPAMKNMILLGASAINYDQIQGYYKIEGIEADVIDIDEVKAEVDHVVCAAKLKAKGSIGPLNDVFERVSRDSGTDFISQKGMKEIEGLVLALDKMKELSVTDEGVETRLQNGINAEQITISSDITFAVNPNNGSLVFVGWRHSSRDNYLLSSYAREATAVIERLLAHEIRSQGYESFEHKIEIEGSVRDTAIYFNKLEQIIESDSSKLAALTEKQVELTQQLSILETEKSALEVKVKPIIDGASSKIMVVNSPNFTFERLFWDTTYASMYSDLLPLTGKVKNNSSEVAEFLDLEGWIFLGDVSNPIKVTLYGFFSKDLAPGEFGTFSGELTPVDVSLKPDTVHSVYLSTLKTNASLVGGWFRPANTDTDKQNKLPKAIEGEEVFRYIEIVSEAQTTVNSIKTIEPKITGLNQSIESARLQRDDLYKELVAATKSLPKTSALYQKFAGANVKASL